LWLKSKLWEGGKKKVIIDEWRKRSILGSYQWISHHPTKYDKYI
jgi:hypothetical protein